MEDKIKVEAKIVKKIFLWFLPYSADDIEVMSHNGPSKFKATMNHSFDYEQLAKEDWRIHIDICLDVLPIAKIKARTIADISCKEKHLFQLDLLTKLNTLAIETAQRGFVEQCKVHDISIDELKFQDTSEYVKRCTPGMIEQFNLMQVNIANLPKYKEGGLTVTYGKKTNLMLSATFLILDEVLHKNKLFNLKRNQEVFHKLIPEPLYYTIKLNCMELAKGEIKLSFRHYAFFLICLDCAIQLLLDRHANTLMPELVKRGFTNEKQETFIAYSSKFLGDIMDKNKKEGVVIVDLEKRYNWNSLFD